MNRINHYKPILSVLQLAFYACIVLGVLLTSCNSKQVFNINTNPTFKLQDSIAITIKPEDTLRIKNGDSLYNVGNNTLIKNKYGLFELYLEGTETQIGLARGSLLREALHNQERAIIEYKLSSNYTSEHMLKFSEELQRYNFLASQQIPKRYKDESNAMSLFLNSKFDTIASKQTRAIFYNGFYDLEHKNNANKNLKSTAFAVWDKSSYNGELLIARNFDFHINTAFNAQNVIEFVNPSCGYKYVSYTWPGQIGVVSGMNEFGVTVTVNSAKSKAITGVGMPVTLLARYILETSRNSYDARRIANTQPISVAQSIMVGSAIENRAIVLELSPTSSEVFRIETTNPYIVNTNHFESSLYSTDSYATNAKFESHSIHRFERLHELLKQLKALTPKRSIAVLREKRGLHDSLLGYGNSRAIQSLNSHHAIVFKPKSNTIWLSTASNNLGSFIEYNIKNAFKKFTDTTVITKPKYSKDKRIDADVFLSSKHYQEYLDYQKLYTLLIEEIQVMQPVPDALLQRLILLNPHQWEAYALVGDYFFMRKDFNEALEKYQAALDLRVTSSKDYKSLQSKIEDCIKSLNKFQN